MTQYPLIVRDDWQKPKRLEDWPRIFQRIFGEPNNGQPYTWFTERMMRWALLMTSPKYHGRSGFPALERASARFFAWLCGLLTQIKFTELSKSVFLEYPGVCPYCFSGKCRCLTAKVRAERDREHANRLGLERWAERAAVGFSLNSLADHACAIFEDNLTLPLSDIAGKVAEEVSEFVREVRNYKERFRAKTNPEGLEKVAEELADVLMWFGTLLRKIAIERDDSNADLDRWMWAYWENGCPDCSPMSGRVACTCDRGAIDKQLLLFEMG